MSLKSKKHLKAFTLAEVLITLLIIGVIAAIVVPNLINDSKEVEFKVAAKKAYAEISQVINQMKLDKGTLSTYIGNSVSLKPDFMNYFSVLKDGGVTGLVNCNVDPSQVYKSLMGGPVAGWVGGEGQFVTNDGMFINIQNSGSAMIMFAVDVNGYQKGPNVYGKDVFVFQLLNDKLVPMGANGTWYTAPTNCNRTTDSVTQGIGCAVYMLQDKDY